jgi:multidrug efflux pump subunit AcrB
MRTEPNARSIRHDWGIKVKVASVQLAEIRARNIGATRAEIGNTLRMTFDGVTTGIFRKGDDLLPIIVRPTRGQREGIRNLDDVQVRSALAASAVPIGQITDGVKTTWEDGKIHRRNRMRTIAVSCQQRKGTADTLFRKLRGRIEAIQLPPGYKLEWGGEYEEAEEANHKLMTNVPLAFALMFLITVILFNTIRHAIIIFLGLPLAVIGVTAGLLITNQPFGFMATLGFLSLAGMLIKNEIVLLDQINLEISSGKDIYTAVIDAAISRVRPVCMAAFTTVFGMIPLLWDAFFSAMAVTIMAGLTFATLLTLIVAPVLYTTIFRVHKTV